MIDLQFINAVGGMLNAIHNGYMTLVGVDGLHGVDNEMSSSQSPYFDGDNINHIRTNPRHIVLTYKLTPPIPEAIKYFNSIVKSKQEATLIETQDDGKQIQIKGIVTVPPYTRWSNRVAVQIQMYCEQPYWQDIDDLVEKLTGMLTLHYFPFDTQAQLEAYDGGLAFPEEDNSPYTDSNTGTVYTGIPFGEIETELTKIIVNDGDIPVGAKITIVALDTVTNPTITNTTTKDWLKINVTLNAGDYIEINTNRGEKEIKINGEDAWDKLTYSGNDWLQIKTGHNEIIGTADETNITNMYFSVQCVRGWQ